MKFNWIYAALIFFIIMGFLYRYTGIMKNLSYWNDEDHTAQMARGILWYGKPVTQFNRSNGLYQIGFYYLTSLSFKYLGLNEFSGRFPSLLCGTFLVLVAFIVSKKLTNNHKVGLLTAALVSLSQIQLAWSTQLRPYIWLELFLILTIFYSYQFLQNKRHFFDVNICMCLVWSIISVLLHGSGFIAVALVCSTILIKIIRWKKYSYLLSLIPIAIMSLLILRYTFENAIPQLFIFDFRVWHYIAFFKEYIWLLIPSFFGSIFLWYKNKNLFIVLPVFIVIIFALAIFKLNTQYVRYSLPAMPLLYILFSIGFFALLDLLSFKQSRSTKTIVSIVLLLGFIGTPIVKGKIIVWPKYYYSINNDVRENPIVDYKLAFERIRKMIGDKKNVIVMDAWNDRVPYYLPGQNYIWLYRNAKKGGEIDSTYGEMVIGNTYDYEIQRKKYPFGIVIVENWESMTPPELQDHIRNTLKHEFDVSNLPYNENDKWSISIYSWGF